MHVAFPDAFPNLCDRIVMCRATECAARVVLAVDRDNGLPRRGVPRRSIHGVLRQ